MRAYDKSEWKADISGRAADSQLQQLEPPLHRKHRTPEEGESRH